ncbi:hypothetical protein F5B17DRAFT_448052 [Nemania serpens]|nr:hypothetical protein F5B17DRAFT_448052 [Nemania serpens]
MLPPARPDCASDADDYIPVREMSLRKDIVDSFTKRPPKTDREIIEYDEYLRRKWGGTEAIPDSFDPDKLDAVLKSRRSSTRTRGGPSEADENTTSPVVSKGDDMFKTPAEPQNTRPEDTSASIPDDTYVYDYCAAQTSSFANSEGKSLHVDDKVEEHEAEVSIHSINEPPPIPMKNTARLPPQPSLHSPRDRGRSMSDIPGQALPPRIRAGSRPPLSRSAFAEGGVPCLDERCQGACKRGVVVKGHPRAPEYFPFKGQARRPSRSRDRRKRNSTCRVDTYSGQL